MIKNWTLRKMVGGFVLGVAGLFATHVGAQVPNAPLDLTATASFPGDLAITLFWVDDSLNEDAFEIQRCSGNGCQDFVTIDVSDFNNINSYNDVGLLENTTYTYRVRAINVDGPSAFSNIASAKTSYARPNQVSNLQGSYAAGAVQLTWTDNATNETVFEVERVEIGVGTQYDVIASLNPNTTSYTDRTMLAGTTYSYRVRPLRFDVEGGAPDTVDLAIGTPIASPTAVAAKAKSATAIEISWKGKFAKGTHVQVQRFNFDTATWVTVGQSVAEEKKFVDNRLLTKTTYLYRIRTITSSAVSLWENTSATTR